MSDPSAAEALVAALQRLEEGETRTRPVSMSLPGPLVDGLQQLVAAGVVPSTSAALTDAVTTWAYNRLLRLTLDELYAEQPDLRPGPAELHALAERLGVAPPSYGEVP